MDSETINQGLTTAQAVTTVLGSMGAWQAGKYLVDQWHKRREAVATEKAAVQKADQDQQEKDHEYARLVRKDAIKEQASILDRQERRIGALEEQVVSLNAANLECEKRAARSEARLEARLEASELDRKIIKNDVADLKKAVNGGTG